LTIVVVNLKLKYMYYVISHDGNKCVCAGLPLYSGTYRM